MCIRDSYDDAEFTIVKGNTVLGNLMDDVRFYGELALVREGIEKIHEALPDYKYVPMRDVREAMYPEKMNTEQLAEALDEIAEAFDPYEYRDNVEMGENTVQEVMPVSYTHLDVYKRQAHSYKNAFLYTKMRNVAGIAQNEAQKSADMFNKCQYLDEITGGKGITFATGTPISNSMTELYVMQRYLQNRKLQNMGLGLFDSWASTCRLYTSRCV